MSKVVEELLAVFVWFILFTLVLGLLVKCQNEVTSVSFDCPLILLQRILQGVFLKIPEGGYLVFTVPELGQNYTLTMNLTEFGSLISIHGGETYIVEKIDGRIEVYPYGG